MDKPTQKRSGADWLALAGAWEESGLSQGAFCRERGLKLATFSYWRNKYLASQRDAEADFVALVPRSEPLAGPSGERIMLHYGEVSLAFAASTPAGYVADVMFNLARRC